MRRLKQTDLRLRRDGPTFDVRLEPVLAAQRVMRDDGDEVPSVVIKALVDTGASETLVQTDAVDKLGLDFIGTVLLTTPSTVKPLLRYEYRVRIVLSETIAFETDIAEGALAGQNVQCLIGRDILEEVIFTYHGPGSRFVFSVP